MKQRIELTGYKSQNIAENIAESSAIQYQAGTSVEFGTPGSGQVKFNGAVVPPHTPKTLAKDLLDMWMNSPGHRRNILSSKTEIGCGVAFYQDGSLNNAMLVKACQVFGEPEAAPDTKPMPQPQPTEPDAEKSSFPKGYFYMTNKYVEGQDYVLESAPVTLRKRGNYSGMVWKAIPAGNGYFFLTTQYLEGQNQVLEGGDGQGPAVMVPNKGYSGTMWKPISAGGGYFYLTSAYMESQKKVLEGNVGDANADPRDNVYKGAPHMVTGNPTGTMWKFIPAN